MSQDYRKELRDLISQLRTERDEINEKLHSAKTKSSDQHAAMEQHEPACKSENVLAAPAQ